MHLGKNFTAGAALLMTIAALAACGNGKDKSASSKTTSKKTITWSVILNYPTAPTGQIQKQLEKYTGENLKLNWIQAASADEKINAALASKSLSDITSLTNVTNTTTRNAMKSGMFWDVEKYLKDYPNLAKISKQTLASAKVNGHLYGVPFQKVMSRYGIVIRKDWLDKLGLPLPKTVDDLKTDAKAFTENDPDGDGKKDTVGFVERNESFNVGFRNLTGYFGAGCQFALVDGKIIPSFMQPEYKDALKWFRTIYKNGWMNSDFSVMSKPDQKNYLAQGKGGITSTGLIDANGLTLAEKGTNQEGKAKWVAINNIVGEDGKRHILSDTNGGFGGWLAISKSSVKSVSELKTCLKFINDLMDEKPYVLMTEGQEGVEYKLNDKKQFVRIDENKWEQEVQPMMAARPSDVKALPYADNQLNEINKKIAQNDKYAVVNPAQALSSSTYDTKWSTLIEPVSDAYYKYMTGEIGISGWDSAIKEFRESGGNQVIKEFTASYNKQNK